jgi:GT2 family glycosyltransferase
VARQPGASVILPAYHSAATIAASLQSLARQTFTDFEVIVVDSSGDDLTGAIVRDRFPQARYVHHPARLLPHEARNLGAREARGRVLVFTDPDCAADPAWLERLMAHHGRGPALVGGAVGCGAGWWNRSVHAAKFPWWLPESPAGPRPEIPSGNSSMAREIWDRVGGFRGEFFAGDSELCWRARRAGYPIWFEPRAPVTHVEHSGLLPFARERFRRGRDFGAMRIEVGRWSRAACVGRLTTAAIVPALMTWRSARYAVRGGYVGRWLTTLPVQILANSLWSAGEALAHAKGGLGSSPSVRSGAP